MPQCVEKRPIAKVSPASETKKIVVIGSTGFLGPYMVASLLRKDACAEVLCINRSSDGEERTVSALRKIMSVWTDCTRLRFVTASIAGPKSSLEDIMTEPDVIIFNAWNSNWSLALEEFAPFLQALQNIVDFSVSRVNSPRVLFISSICAIGEWPRNHAYQQCIPEVVPPDCSNAMAHGYGESKCIAELILARASAIFGLRVAIIRAGQIGGSISGNSSWPIQGWIYSIISTSRRIGYWPSHVQPLDWIPVDALTEGITRIIWNRQKTKDMQVYNMVHPNPAPWNLLFATLQDKFSLRATEIGLPEWLDLLSPETIRLYEFLRAAGPGRENDMAFDTTNASQMMPELASLTKEQLEIWLEAWCLPLSSADVTAKL